MQPTGCGGRVIEAKVEDYLARYDVPAREKTDVRWAQTCMDLEDVVEPLDAALEPPLRRRMQAKLWQALYFKFDDEKRVPPSAGRKPRLARDRAAKTDGLSAEKERLSKKVIDIFILIDN